MVEYLLVSLKTYKCVILLKRTLMPTKLFDKVNCEIKWQESMKIFVQFKFLPTQELIIDSGEEGIRVENKTRK